jgi:glycosyltransferase involved in cell wall biosynthesis
VVNLGFNLIKFTENKDEKRTAFRTKFKIQPDDIAIGIVGRLVPIKNHDLFIRAIAILKTNGINNIRAFIIGDGELRDELSHLCKDLSIDYSWDSDTPATIQFTSWIKDMDQAYPGMDVIALTSLNEGTPVTLIEAQASSLPIVSTNVGGIEDIVLKSKTALLSDSEDLIEFSKNLNEIVTNTELRYNMSGAGVDFAIKKFNHLRLAADMAKLYESLLSNVS